MYDQSQQKALFDRTKALLTSEISVEEIEDVRDLLRYHEWKYYVENNPVISDFEYD